jgi:hypothetical protein
VLLPFETLSKWVDRPVSADRAASANCRCQKEARSPWPGKGDNKKQLADSPAASSRSAACFQCPAQDLARGLEPNRPRAFHLGILPYPQPHKGAVVIAGPLSPIRTVTGSLQSEPAAHITKRNLALYLRWYSLPRDGVLVPRRIRPRWSLLVPALVLRPLRQAIMGARGAGLLQSDASKRGQSVARFQGHRDGPMIGPLIKCI